MRVIGLDITCNGRRLGELFDFLVHVGDVRLEKPPAPATPDKGKY